MVGVSKFIYIERINVFMVVPPLVVAVGAIGLPFTYGARLTPFSATAISNVFETRLNFVPPNLTVTS